jgi:predicted nucleic acid-binding protein
MVIVDTTVWIDYFHDTSTPQTEWLDRELTQQRLGLLDLILCEVLQGVSTEEEAAEVLRELRAFEIFESTGGDVATRAARNYRTLRRHGHTVRKTIDCLIATFCIAGGHALLHNDQDFDPFEQHLGLAVIHPSARSSDPDDDEPNPSTDSDR